MKRFRSLKSKLCHCFIIFFLSDLTVFKLLLKFSNEKQILEKAYNEYLELKKNNLWGSRKYF